jgi:hypothetical protein
VSTAVAAASGTLRARVKRILRWVAMVITVQQRIHQMQLLLSGKLCFCGENGEIFLNLLRKFISL